MSNSTIMSGESLSELMKRIKNVFRNGLGLENARKYILGLMSEAERKNGWQLAESLGEKTPYALQQFIYRGNWDADDLRDELYGYVTETLGEADAVLIMDETGFLKQGKKSCGVKRQYSGTAGRIQNCQIGVFLTYSSEKGHTMLDRRLYLPEEWTGDMERRKAAGIPDEIDFQTKPALALEMLKQASAQGVPYTWVTGDSVYGDYRDIRTWCEVEGKSYVMCVSSKEYVWIGFKQHRVSELMKTLAPETWLELSCGDGSKGERIYDWQFIQTNAPPREGWKRHLLIRRNKTNGELRAYACCAPEATPPQKLLEVAGRRWEVEDSFAETKSMVGLDQYEVRSYNGWYKHITLACLAHALLTHLSVQTGAKSAHQLKQSSSSLDDFKRGRGLRV